MAETTAPDIMPAMSARKVSGLSGRLSVSAFSRFGHLLRLSKNDHSNHDANVKEFALYTE
eukprot:3845367-Pyramimonas_sp.AAC.1